MAAISDHLTKRHIIELLGKGQGDHYFQCHLSNSKRRPEKFRPEQD